MSTTERIPTVPADSPLALEPAARSRMSVGTLIARALDNFGSETLLIDEDGSVTYAEFRDRVLRGASALKGLGVVHGEPVGLVAANTRGFCEVEYASVLSGFVRCAEVPRLHPTEVAGMFAAAGVRVAVVQPDWVQKLTAVRDRIPTLEHIVTLGPAVDGAAAWDDLLAAAQPEPITDLPAAEDDAWLVFSSGTTGEPKGIVLTHGGLANMVRNIHGEVGELDETDVLVHAAPLGHMSGCLFVASMIRGGAQLLMSSFDGTSLLQAVERHRVTWMIAVPTMLVQLTDLAEELDLDTSSLRRIMYGASPMMPDRLVRAIAVFGDIFVQAYGLSEVPMPMTLLRVSAHRFDPALPPPQRLKSAGRPVVGVELEVVDEQRQPLPRGSVGEIAIRSDVRMRGYWNRPELTAEVLSDDGWFYTGDVGRFDEEGYLYIVDRKKDMIVSGGFNVYPNEVEQAISALPGVLEVAVVGAPDDRWGEAIVAVVVPRPGVTLVPDAIIAGCREQIAGYKCPKSVEVWDEIPKSPRGKPLRRAVRDRFWQDAGRSI
ncbi:Long-chain-fatty-acid--CoA ligase [Paraconexibacter sp. AEG42_29]|uniref:Long-chain-fatty-acid--CoA ligase n=1 Tax=Paraconexibacter sp. AEG42_29 TaxID=2997339 RepID=A0AAU7ATR3_9ACTN